MRVGRALNGGLTASLSLEGLGRGRQHRAPSSVHTHVALRVLEVAQGEADIAAASPSNLTFFLSVSIPLCPGPRLLRRRGAREGSLQSLRARTNKPPSLTRPRRSMIVAPRTIQQ